MDLVLLKPGSVELAGTGSIDGEQMEVGDDLAGCLELVSIHFGMRQQVITGASNSGSSTDRPVLQDITAIKYVDERSPLLYKHCLTTIPIDDGETPTQIFLCRNDNSVLRKFMTIKLWNCQITSVDVQSHPNDMATEQITLSFTSIEWSTSCKDSRATTSGGVAFSWESERGVVEACQS